MLYKFISFRGNSIMSKNFYRGIRRQGQPPPDWDIRVQPDIPLCVLKPKPVCAVHTGLSMTLTKLQSRRRTSSSISFRVSYSSSGFRLAGSFTCTSDHCRVVMYDVTATMIIFRCFLDISMSVFSSCSYYSFDSCRADPRWTERIRIEVEGLRYQEQKEYDRIYRVLHLPDRAQLLVHLMTFAEVPG